MSRKILPISSESKINNGDEERWNKPASLSQGVQDMLLASLTSKECLLLQAFATILEVHPTNHLRKSFDDRLDETKETMYADALECAYSQFEDIKLGAIDILLCPDKSLISRQFTIRCYLIKTIEAILLLYSFASVPIYENPFLAQLRRQSNTKSASSFVPLSIAIVFIFAYYVQLNLVTSMRNSLLIVATKDFVPIKNWKYRVKFASEIVEIALLISLCFFALSTYIYEYNLELIFNGMAVIFIAEFDELTIDLYLHGNSKRATYYHKLICLAYIKDNYVCKNHKMMIQMKMFDRLFTNLKREKDNEDRHSKQVHSEVDNV